MFRDKAILRLIFIMPMVQLLILPLAADYEVRNVRITVVDQDHSTYTRQLVDKISASAYFDLIHYGNSYEEALQFIEEDKAELILNIPPLFEKQLLTENTASLFIAVNAINGVKANLGGVYLRNIISDFNQDIRMDWIQSPGFSPRPIIQISALNWFNPLLNYQYFMVPGILVILVTMVGAFLSALNIVKEKEVGTIEQINVTPIRKHQFILGKLIPFWILGLIVLGIGMVLSWLFYGIVSEGSLGTVFTFAALYLLAVLGLGLLVSTYSQTQQQSMLISFFFMMIFVLLSGLYTAIESMPMWAQIFARFNPVTYFIEVMRMVVLRGSSLFDIRYHILVVTLFAIVLNGWAILNYKKRV
ncbi:MAG: ABC transporter permease [Flammeovirgaceae bacterium]|nr:ABC transporter permease [Flammeovirgaceae bacterium]